MQSIAVLDKMFQKIKKSSKRVLVTGGFGYIGSELVKEFVRHEIEYISIDAKNTAGKNMLSFDLCDRKKTVDVIEKFKPDVFVHCGTHSAMAYRDRFLASFNEDISALTNILEALVKFPSCRLIYFSSSYVYSGISSTVPVVESMPLQPVHNFGVAKSFFEQLAIRSHPNTVVFRLSSVFGPGNALNPNSVFNMAKECLETGSLTVWGTGSRKVQYVSMQEVLTYICEAFSFHPGISNLGGNEYTSVAESARAIAEFFGAKVVFLDDKKEGETLPFMSTKKLKQQDGDYFTPFRYSMNEYLESLRIEFPIAKSNQPKP